MFLGATMEDFSNKIKDSVWWWLGKKRPFIINNEYRLELLFIDKINNSAKIKITNIKTGQVIQEISLPEVISHGEI